MNKLHFLKSTGLSFVLNAGGYGFNFIFSFLVSKLFGAGSFGVFSVCYSFVLILSMILTMGFDRVIVKYTAILVAEERFSELKNLLVKIMLFLTGTALLSTILGLYIADDLSALFFDKTTDSFYMKLALWSLFPIILLNFTSAVLKGFKKGILFTFLQNFSRFFLATTMLLLLWFYNSKTDITPILALLGALIISSVLSCILAVFHLKKSKVQEVNKSANENFKKVFLEALPMFVSASLLLIMTWADTLMLGYFMEETEVGYYNMAVKFATVTTLILASVNAISTPVIAELFYTNSNELQPYIYRISKLLFWTTLPIVAVLIIFGKAALEYLGLGFGSGYWPMVILCIGQLTNSISGPIANILQMTGNQVSFQYLMLAALIINIGLNLVLIPLYGLNGAAIATATGIIIANIGGNLIMKYKMGYMAIYLPKFTK